MTILSRISIQLFLICLTTYSFAGTEPKIINTDEDGVCPAFYIDNSIGAFQEYFADNINIPCSQIDSVDVSFTVDTAGAAKNIEVKGANMDLWLKVTKALNEARFVPSKMSSGNSHIVLQEYDANFRIVFNAPYDSINQEEVRYAWDYKKIRLSSGPQETIHLLCTLNGDSVSDVNTGQVWVAVNRNYSGHQKAVLTNGSFKLNIHTENWQSEFFDLAFQFDKYRTLVIRSIPVNDQELEIPLTYNGQKQQMNYFGNLEFLARLSVKTK